MPINLKTIHKKDVRFINGKIYMIKWDKYFYIGSTFLSLKQRLKNHIHDLKHKKFSDKHKFYNILKNIDLNELKIELIENWSCDNELQLLNREGFWHSYYNSINNEYGLNYRYAYRSPIYNHIKHIKFAFKKRGLTPDDNEFYKLLVKCKKFDNSSQKGEYYITNIKDKCYYINMKKQEYIDILIANDSGLTDNQKKLIPKFIDTYYYCYKIDFNIEEPNLVDIFNNIDFLSKKLNFNKLEYSAIGNHIRNIEILNEQFTFLNENTIKLIETIKKENNKRNKKLKGKKKEIKEIKENIEETIEEVEEEIKIIDKDIQTDNIKINQETQTFEEILQNNSAEIKIKNKIKFYEKEIEKLKIALEIIKNL